MGKGGTATPSFWADADDEVALERYRTLVNTVDDGIYQLDAVGRFVAVNDIIVEMCGFSREELLGSHVSLFLEDDDVERIARDIRDELTSDGHLNEPYEFTVRTAEGGTVPCELRVSLIVEDGTFRGTVGVVRDISDRRRTEQALLRRERQLQRERDLTDRIVETIPVSVVVFDRDGNVTRTNEHIRELLDIPDLSNADRAAFPPSDVRIYDEDGTPVPTERRPSVRARETKEPVEECVLRVERPNGESRWVSISATPILTDDGAVDRVVTAAEDVTALKERELRLERQTDELTAEIDRVYGRITDAFYALDGQWRFTYVNDRAEEVLEFSADELVGRTIWDAFEWAGDSKLREKYEEAMEIQEATHFEMHYPDALDAWYEVHAYPSETGLSVYFRDITERKCAEQRLERTKSQLESLFRVLPVGVIVADADGRTVEANDMAKKIWGGDVFAAESIADYERYPIWWADTGDPVAPAETTMSRVLDGHAVTDPDVFEIESADGERRVVTALGMPVPNENGDVTHGVVTLTDISERREYQRKLEESNERLEQFAYAASHDLQEPLRMVSNYLSLIERRYGDALDEDGEEFLEFAVDGAERMRRMIEGLLQYARVETQGDPFEPVALDSVLEETRSDLQMRIEETDAEVTSEGLPRVCGDASQLRQVFQNLLDNALKYSGDGPPRIRVSAERSVDETRRASPTARNERRSGGERRSSANQNASRSGDGGYWRIDVTDDGIGIDPEHAERVFEVFQRLHTPEEHEGTGIGLSLCRRIVERHGGTIWVEPEPGGGTTFSFTLPAAADGSS